MQVGGQEGQDMRPIIRWVVPLQIHVRSPLDGPKLLWFERSIEQRPGFGDGGVGIGRAGCDQQGCFDQTDPVDRL